MISVHALIKKQDPFAPIRELWDKFIVNCQLHYYSGSAITIDEQLLGFRGKCPFRVFEPNKRPKYGIKIVMACDSSTKYVCSAIPYLGKGTKTNGLPVGHFFVKELTKHLINSKRNITTSKWFTSVPLADDLFKDKLTLVGMGTLKLNKREMIVTKGREVGSAIYGFDKEKNLVSYKTKKLKIVVLLSTYEYPGMNEVSCKPDIMEFYNSMKSSVKTFDQMFSINSCSRKTRRWPLCVFYGVINIACFNSYILHVINNSQVNKKPLSKKNYLISLSKALTEPWMKKRLSNSKLPRELRSTITCNLGESTTQVAALPDPSERKRKICYLCPSRIRRMITTYCKTCHKAFCKEYRAEICVNCI